MRKLVTIRTVASILPIPDADNIERAAVDGWKCVVMKGEFKPGDRCLYLEIDSFLPEGDPRFEFLMEGKIEWNGHIGVRIRTREFLKQLSQGLALPLDQFPEVLEMIAGLDEKAIRAIDFTEVVGVLKWEALIPDELADEVQGGMPSFLPETGGDRIQNMLELIAESPDEEFEESLKLDGWSASVFHHQGQSGICGRNWWFKDEVENEYTRTVDRQRLLAAIKKHPLSMGLQGELIGPGIRGNKERLAEKEFRVFRIWDIANGCRFNPDDRNRIVQELRDLGANVLTTKFTGIFKLSDLGSIDNMLARADGPSLNPEVNREGLFYNSVDGRGCFKVINNRYLLKNKNM